MSFLFILLWISWPDCLRVCPAKSALSEQKIHAMNLKSYFEMTSYESTSSPQKKKIHDQNRGFLNMNVFTMDYPMG
jgi:hypothetical protein